MLLVPHREFESMQAKHVYPFKQHYRAAIKDHVDVADPRACRVRLGLTCLTLHRERDGTIRVLGVEGLSGGDLQLRRSMSASMTLWWPSTLTRLRPLDVASGGRAAMTQHLAAAVRSTESHRDSGSDRSSVAAAFDVAAAAAFATANDGDHG